MNSRRLGLEEQLAIHDQAVASSAGIDQYCSSSRWVGPAFEAFMGHAVPLISWADEAGSALFAAAPTAAGVYLAPLEAIWGLAAPCAGSTPQGAARATLRALESCETAWVAALVGGIEPGSTLERALVTALAPTWTLRPLPVVTRQVASLEGGTEGFLSRRSRKFRANLRAARAQANDAGLNFEVVLLESVDDATRAFERVLPIEHRSWKSLSDQGVAKGPMAEFTRGVLTRSAKADGAVAVFATLGGQDVGYLYGALTKANFRGLQMSFVEEVRPLAVGNLMQLTAIEWLCRRGVVEYDLGSDLPYKRRWAERERITRGLLVIR